MSLDYLEDLESAVENGTPYYASPSTAANRWMVSRKLGELEKQAQKAANVLGYKVSIFRLVDKADTSTSEQYLIVKKIEEPGPNGEPRLLWSLVGTKEAAEMLRDVSQGPTPFFGVVTEKNFDPEEAA